MFVYVCFVNLAPVKRAKVERICKEKREDDSAEFKFR